MKLLNRIRTMFKGEISSDTVDSEHHQIGDDHHDPINIEEQFSVEEQLITVGEDELPEQQTKSEQSAAMVAQNSVGLAVALTVMAEDGDHFEGSDLLREFNAADFEYGMGGIYHAYPLDSFGRPSKEGMQTSIGGHGSARPLFSVGNVLKPGKFDQQQIMNLRTTGIVLFFQLPGEHSGKLSFEKMVETAHQLAVGLGGNVCDENRVVLTPHSLQRLRDQVYEFEYNRELESRRTTIEQSQQR